MGRLLLRLRGWLAPVADRPLFFAALALLLASPSLAAGLSLDDLFHRHFLLGRAPFDGRSYGTGGLFSAFHGDPAEARRSIDVGFAPWFTNPRLQLAFLRPLAELTHRIDYALWPRSPWLMHLHSLLWFAAMVAAVAVLARRLLGNGFAAALLALLFAIDHTHATPAGWIANRNALIAAAFGWLALLAHDRWRRDGWKAGAIAGPALFAIALLAGEAAVATGGWLLAYALFIDGRGDREQRLGRRLLRLAPYVAIGLVWQIAYRAAGYGTAGSGFYVDPGSEPLAYFAAAAQRVPVLVVGALGLSLADSVMLLRPREALGFAIAAAGFTAAIVWLFAPLVRRDPVARFFALGATLSLLPVAATLPANRLLLFASFGAMGLLALTLAAHVEPDVASAADAPHGAKRAARLRHGAIATTLTAFVAAIHLVAAPLLTPALALVPKIAADAVTRALASYPTDAALADDDVIVVAAPDFFFTASLPFVRVDEGRPRPRRILALSSGPVALEATRRDERTLELRFDGGLLADPLSSLFRGPSAPMAVGDVVELDGLTVMVAAVTDDGRPAAARFTFARTLDDAHLRWLVWDRDRFVAWRVPPLGASTTIAPAWEPWSHRGGE